MKLTLEQYKEKFSIETEGDDQSVEQMAEYCDRLLSGSGYSSASIKEHFCYEGTGGCKELRELYNENENLQMEIKRLNSLIAQRNKTISNTNTRIEEVAVENTKLLLDFTKAQSKIKYLKTQVKNLKNKSLTKN